jgi:hypothetical protein
MSHRVVYEALVGPIPEEAVIDHLCRVRNCVNPDHLEPTTTKVNILRGTTPSADNARKTHCKQGHAFDSKNTAVYDGHRMCRVCNRAYQRARYAQSKK